jgi:hypothetical protein
MQIDIAGKADDAKRCGFPDADFHGSNPQFLRFVV